MKLAKSPKIFEGYKSAKPEDTIYRIENGFEKIGFSVHHTEYIAGDGKTKFFSERARLIDTNFSASGKGNTPILAKASALAELAERFSVRLYFLGVRAPYWFTHDDLEIRYINYEYRADAIKAIYESIPDKINFEAIVNYNKDISSADIDLLKKTVLTAPWLKYYCLSDKKYYNAPDYLISVVNGSNGLASGNTIEEAIAQALSEIFERYPHLEIIKKKINPLSINPESIDNPTIQSYISFLSQMNIEVDIKDCTFKGRYPVIGVVFTNHNLDNCDNLYHKKMFRKIFKAGAHVNKDEALERCFTEYFQGKTNEAILSTKDSSVRKKDDIYWKYILKENISNAKIPDDYYDILLTNSLYFGDLHFLDKTSELIDYSNVLSFDSDDFFIDIEYLLGLVHNLGKKVYVQDWTHKVLKFPTVRVIVPGMSDITLQMRKNSDYLFMRNSDKQMFLQGRVYSYFNSNEWLKSKEGILNFLDIIENALSEFPPFEVNINTLEKTISIYDIAFFLCLVVGEYGKAYKYFIYLNPPDEPRNRLLGEFLRLHSEGVTGREIYDELRSKFSSNDVAEMLRYLISIEFSSEVEIRNPFVPYCYYSRLSGEPNGYCAYESYIKKAMKSFFPHSAL